MEKEQFYAAAFEAIMEVPSGKVTTYGHIARLIGRPECPRQVGMALKQLPRNPALQFNESTVPWQRIINSKGQISPRGVNGATRQADALRLEGVNVERNAMGEYTVDLSEYGWFPDELPNEAGSEDE